MFFSRVVLLESVQLGFFKLESIYTVAGPEFGDFEGCLRLILNSLYGLCTSAARWHEVFTKTLCLIGFHPLYTDLEMYIKDFGTHYKYMCIYVDNILEISKSLMTIINGLKTLYILMGVEELEFYIGRDITKAII